MNKTLLIRHHTMGVAIFLGLCGFVSLASAQQSDRSPHYQGMIMENGEWKAPTLETAMRKLLDSDGPYTAAWAVAAVLNSTYKSYSSAKLDAFSVEIGRIFVEGEDWQRANAAQALRLAGRSDVIINVYESREPGSNTPPTSLLFNMLGGHEGKGLDYLRMVLSNSEKPEICNENPRSGIIYPEFKLCELQEGLWCKAGFELIGFPGGPTQDDWDKRCYVPLDPMGVGVANEGLQDRGGQ
ncbi:MAG: hypothetical protein F4Z62_04600 [Rhodothermaceae bacterium]|nr:hypothetical protein [Rhodothermaceae bacterium]MXW32368.1 hypothetical protein [Rhodothermaceae bacterium]MYE63746.1 hypothetical protein [Rhodothermaceae bacterium]